MNPTVTVSEDLNREPGYSIFTLSGVEGNIERLSYSVVRHGYDYNYLGEREWQAAFAWLEPEDAWYDSGQLKFVVPPDITWQMDPQGYVLKLDLYPPVGELSIEFFWPDVPAAEAATRPDVEHRLSGTRVKPVTAGPAGEPQPAVIPEPDIVAAPEPALPPFEPQAVVEPAPVTTPSPKKGSGKDAVIAIGILLLVAVATVYWFVLRPGDKTASEQTLQPGAPASNEAVDRPEPQTGTGPAPAPVADPEPVAEPSAPVVTEAQVIQEKRGNETQMTEPAAMQEVDTASQHSAPGTPGAGGTDTRDTLTEVLGTGASEKPSRTEDGSFKSIEPALRKKVGE